MTRRTAPRGKNAHRGIRFHPNRRYGHPHALRALTAGLSVLQIAKLLHRHPRTIRNWISERQPVPYWAVELLELRHHAHLEQLRQMGIHPRAALSPVLLLDAKRPVQATAGAPDHVPRSPAEPGWPDGPAKGMGGRDELDGPREGVK